MSITMPITIIMLTQNMAARTPCAKQSETIEFGEPPAYCAVNIVNLVALSIIYNIVKLY